MSQSGIKVLVVDDSPVIRRVLTGILEADPDIAEVHTAPGGNLAMRKIEKLNPDVVTLDVEMPDLDGIQTLKRIMDESPRSVIMVSALTTQGADKTIEALEIGALDVLAKPSGRLSKDISEIGEDLLRKVKAVAHLRFRRRDSKASEAKLSKSLSPVDVFKGSLPYQIVAIGASTGGTDAIRKLLSCLPADYPAGLVIAQHMPEGFTASFAARLNELSAVEVKEASHRDMVLPGRVLLAPGHSHMRVHRDEFGTWVELRKDAKVNGHRPSVDVLFDSVAESFGKDVAAILLTGMGRDGASALGRLYELGAFTMAQDEESSVVFGMPKAAIKEGSVVHVGSPVTLGRVLSLGRGREYYSKSDNNRKAKRLRANDLKERK